MASRKGLDSSNLRRLKTQWRLLTGGTRLRWTDEGCGWTLLDRGLGLRTALEAEVVSEGAEVASEGEVEAVTTKIIIMESIGPITMPALVMFEFKIDEKMNKTLKNNIKNI